MCSLCVPYVFHGFFCLEPQSPWRSADQTIVVSAPHWAVSTPPTARCASRSTSPCCARARSASRRPTNRGHHGWSPSHSRDRGRPKGPKAGATNKGATGSPPFRRATAELGLWAKLLRALGRNGGGQYPKYPEIPGRRWISVGVRGPLGPPFFGRSSRAYRNASSRETRSAPAAALGQGHESPEKVPWPLKNWLRYAEVWRNQKKWTDLCGKNAPAAHLSCGSCLHEVCVRLDPNMWYRLNLEARGRPSQVRRSSCHDPCQRYLLILETRGSPLRIRRASFDFPRSRLALTFSWVSDL